MQKEFPKELKFYPDNRENVKWKVPGLFDKDNVIWLLDDICKELKIRQPIHTVFGGITSPWQGGRLPQIDTITEEELYKTIETYNQRNISCHITFSNYRVEEKHLDDYIGNLVCRVLNKINASNNKDLQNGMIISSDILSDYIREKYPNIMQIASVLKPSYEFPNYDETPEYYNRLLNHFDSLCIRPEYNTDIDFLNKLEHKDRIEVMVNQFCFKKCPLAVIHYDNSLKYTPEDDSEARRKSNMCHPKIAQISSIYDHLANSSEQIDRIVEMGFYNLKLAGRGYSPFSLVSHVIGRYIFEPTGYFHVIEDYIFKKLSGVM